MILDYLTQICSRCVKYACGASDMHAEQLRGCVYIYIYIYTHTHTHMKTYTCTYTYTYPYTYTYKYTYTFTYTYTHKYLKSHYIYTYMHACIHTHVMYISTHTQVPDPLTDTWNTSTVTSKSMLSSSCNQTHMQIRHIQENFHRDINISSSWNKIHIRVHIQIDVFQVSICLFSHSPFSDFGVGDRRNVIYDGILFIMCNKDYVFCY